MSIFGGTNTEIVLDEDEEDSSCISRTSKQAEAEAELAAKLEQARSMQEIQAQQVKLNNLES